MTASESSPLSLLELYLSGKLDDQEAGELLAELTNDPDFGKRALRVIHVDHLLRDYYEIESVDFHGSGNRGPDFESLVSMEKAAPTLEMNAVEQECSSGLKESSQRSRSILRPYLRRYEKFLAGSSALILFMAFVAGTCFEWRQARIHGERNVLAVARIVESVAAEWEEDAEIYKKGQELEPSSLRLKSGAVKLRFDSGAEVILEGPVGFLVRDKNEGFCQYGRLSAFVPPQAVGFEIASPLATVVDLGTNFSMQVGDGKSEIHVLRGKVEVQPPRKEKFQVPEGLASILDLKKEPETIRADPDTFLNDGQLQKRKWAYLKERRSVREEQRARLEADPGLVYRLEPAAVSSLRKCDGSCDDKTAVEFRRSRDRIDIAPGTQCRSLTLLATVRLENMRNAANTLLMGSDFYTTPGAIHWQLNRFGIVQFHISDGKLPLMYETDPIVRRKDYKTWMTLAVVADAGTETITHYLDGWIVKTARWRDPIPLKLDRLALGNQWEGSHRGSGRFFHGAMEDFWIFSRPFSAREIRDYYKNSL